jgi:hypothetical protein
MSAVCHKYVYIFVYILFILVECLKPDLLPLNEKHGNKRHVISVM